MKKNYLIALLTIVVNFASAQIETTVYRGAFAPAPTPMWTDSWTNFDPQNEPYPDAAIVVPVTTNITTNTTWITGKTYKLTGLIYVTNNATLTIQPGVVVKGNFTNTGTALIITRGAKLNAIGTASSPIVFTSAKAAGARAPGDWGGIIMLGKAGLNVNNGVNNIEGITATLNTEFGGGASPINDDNSGTLKYVRIEFPGFVFSPNNEINGLTMGSVGNGTTIDYVQVSHCNDDAFEWFGGSVNCKHLVSFRNLDDDFDTDNGYKGIVQYVLGIRDPAFADNPAISTSEGFESDNKADGNPSGDGLDTTSAIFTNVTMVGPSKRATLSPTVTIASGHERPLRLRRATQLKVYNSIFMDFRNSFLFVDGSPAVNNANANPATLKFKNNIIAGPQATAFTGGVNPTSLNSWFSENGNSYASTSTELLTSPYGTSSADYQTNIDYRPGTTAAIGANFTDSSMTPYITAVAGETPSVVNVSYCVRQLATPLTATLTTTGVSLKWYTVATGGNALPTAPTPSTTLVGVKNFWVSQMNNATTSEESDRVMITVTVNALPTELVGTITGQGPELTAANGNAPAVYASATAIGPYVGTTTQFTYTIPEFTTIPTPLYVWTVPQGVNIISGQGTKSLTVNFNNVAYGIGSLGSIQVQAQNANGCRTAAKTFSLTKALPAAPTFLKMFDKASATPTKALTTFGQFMGTTTPVTLEASYVATNAIYPATLVFPNNYQWELPAGVSLVLNGATATTTSKIYTAEPFLAPTSAPTALGTVFWTVTSNKYTVDVNGVSTNITTSTAVQSIVGTTSTTYTFTIAANAANVNAVNTLFTYNGNTYKLTTATTATSTTAVCTFANLLDFPGTFPTGTSTISGVLQPVNSGNPMPFTRIVHAGYGPTSSQAYLPYNNKYGTVITSDKPAILVSFEGVTNSATTLLYPGVKAMNGVGTSVSNNSTNADYLANNPILLYTNYTNTFTPPVAPAINVTSTLALTTGTLRNSKLLKLTAALPTVPTLTLTNPDSATPTDRVTSIGKFIGTSTPLTLTASAVATASSYVWELPTGVNAVGLPAGAVSTTVDGITTINSTTARSITINFLNVAAGTAPFEPTTMYLGVKAKNGIGLSSVATNGTLTPSSSSTARLLKVTASVPAAPLVTGQITGVCNGSTKTYTITASLLATSYKIVAPIGSVVTSVSNTTNTTNELITSDLTFNILYPNNIQTLAATAKKIIITSINGYGISLTARSLSLTGTCTTPGIIEENEEEEEEVVTLMRDTQVYPNPTTGELNLSIIAVKEGTVNVEIYSMDGISVKSFKSLNLQEGTNIINDNISSLRNGIYLVKFYNTANNEIIVKKLVKN